MVKSPSEYKFSNFKDGYKRLKQGKVVMRVEEGSLRYSNNEDPKSTPNIKMFGIEKYRYPGNLFTKNSPLVPIFKKAATNAFGKGYYTKIVAKWMGGKIKSQRQTETMVLSIGQMFLSFIFIVSSLLISFICFTIECCYFWFFQMINRNNTLEQQ